MNESFVIHGGHERAATRRCGTVHLFDTNICVWDDVVDDAALERIGRTVAGRLIAKGFRVGTCPQTLKNYPSLASGALRGRRGDLEVKSRACGRSLQVEFFQNVANVENPNGGEHDCHKFRRMPRTMQIACAVAMTQVVRKLVELGYTWAPSVDVVRRWTAATRPEPTSPRMRDVLACAREEGPETPLERFNAGWSTDRFERDETGWPTVREYGASYNTTDADGATLRNGATRYFRLGGRLQRATVYTNMNNMWQACFGGSVTYVASWELFSCDDPASAPRRAFKDADVRRRKVFDKALAAGDWKRVAAISTHEATRTNASHMGDRG